MLAKLSNYFLLLILGSLVLFSPFAIEAQTTASGCGEGYVYGQIYEQEPIAEQEPWFNPSNGAWQTRTVWKYKSRLVRKCVPIPPETNSPTSRDKSPNSSDSNGVHSAEVKPRVGLRPPYVGQYSGKWVTTYSDIKGQNGEWTLSVDRDGKITGIEVNTTFDVTGNISGFVSQDGHIELRLKYEGIFKDAPPSSIKGSITNAENRHLKGTLNQYGDGDKITSVIEIDLAPISIEPLAIRVEPRTATPNPSKTLSKQIIEKYNPIQLNSNVIAGVLNTENSRKANFYTFWAVPGQLTITLTVEASAKSGGNTILVTLFDPNEKSVLGDGEAPIGSRLTTTSYGRITQDVFEIDISEKLPILLRIEPYNLGSGKYQIKLDGAIETLPYLGPR